LAKGKATELQASADVEALRRIASELGRVARAILLSATKDATESEQAFYLNLAGFAPVEIAAMYGEPTNVIGARISNVRKAKEKAAKRQRQP